MFKLPELPYPEDGLEPYISQKTLSFHYGKHHKAYIDNLNALLDGEEGAQFRDNNVEEIIREHNVAINALDFKTDIPLIFDNYCQRHNFNKIQLNILS